MILRRRYRFRVYPTVSQAEDLAAWENALRFLWNLAHEQRLIGLTRCSGEKRYPTAYSQSRELTELRELVPWLEAVPRGVCEQVLADLHEAWTRHFSRVSSQPTWRSKQRDVLSIAERRPKMWRIENGNVWFPKLGVIRTVMHRPLVGKPKSVTMKRDGDQWFASILCEVETADPTPRHEPIIAIDRGVANAVADSDGRLVPSARFYEKARKQLARAQRTVSRRKNGSANRDKAKVRVMCIARKVRRQREHFVHGLTSAYAKSHGTVVVEKLQIGNMVRANRGLSRGILDAGWGMLVEQLRYKTAALGGRVVEVPAAYSSQTCHGCGHVDPRSRCSQASFECTECGLVEHADLNAALVLRQRFEAPGNPWCLPVEGSALGAARRSRKPKRASAKEAAHGC